VYQRVPYHHQNQHAQTYLPKSKFLALSSSQAKGLELQQHHKSICIPKGHPFHPSDNLSPHALLQHIKTPNHKTSTPKVQ